MVIYLVCIFCFLPFLLGWDSFKKLKYYGIYEEFQMACDCRLYNYWGVLYLCIFHLGDFYHLRPYFTGRNPYSWHKAAGAIIRLIAYIITSGMCFAVLSLCPFRNLPLLTRIGSRSLQIYFLHQLFRNIIVHYGLLKYLSSPSSKVVYVLLAILLTLILGTRPFGFPVTMIRKLCLNK